MKKPNCRTCINVVADKSKCKGCLGKSTKIQNPDGSTTYQYEYNNYTEGDPVAKLIELQRSGKRNIVLGGEGEHEVNVNWSYEKTLAKLIDRCEDVGGLTWREGTDTIIIDKPFYGGAFHLQFQDGKLRRILKRSRSDGPLIHWWTSKPDYDNIKNQILAAETEKQLDELVKELHTMDFDETEKTHLMEYVRARIGHL